MTPDDIQNRALETWYKPNHDLHFDLIPAVLGLVGEAGEFADLCKKHVYKPGYRAKKEDCIDELGDVLYYLSIIAYQLGVTLDELSRLNYAKLVERRENGTGYNRGIER